MAKHRGKHSKIVGGHGKHAMGKKHKGGKKRKGGRKRR